MNSAGNYETFLISWKFDIDGEIMTNNFNITKDMLKLRNPIVTNFECSAQKLASDIARKGETLQSFDNIVGNYENFDIAWNDAKEKIG